MTDQVGSGIPSSSAPATAPVSYPPMSTSTIVGRFPVVQPQRIPYAVPGGIADPAQNYGDLYLPVAPVIQQNPSGGPLGAHPTIPTLPAQVPVVVLLHGGGWRTPSAAASMSEMARSLVSHGVAVWNVEYRRIGAGGGYPITLTDTAAAIDFLQTVKAQHAPNLDLDNVVVAGHSAGGQLAVWASARSMLTPGAMGSVPAVTPAAVVSMGGVLDMRRAVADGNVNTRLFLGLPDEFPQQFAVADPIQNINPKVPVTCFNGTSDRIVRPEGCESFTAALKAKGGHGQALLLQGAGHNVYLPSQAQNRYWPVVQKSILGYTDEFRPRGGR
ncbi:S9 family peptidase [Tsukamurella sp. 1534]|uniref:alpha/beta hydrolase family protein n=1 Tax=Tsukamurella sp. 1534 TaxID=1151061 RepID=UPI00131EFB1F|nr:alpha/beta hydrolase [Tsukamurella sp. 1534]